MTFDKRGNDPPDYLALGAAAVTAGLHIFLRDTAAAPFYIVFACAFWLAFVLWHARRRPAVLRRWGFRAVGTTGLAALYVRSTFAIATSGHLVSRTAGLARFSTCGFWVSIRGWRLSHRRQRAEQRQRHAHPRRLRTAQLCASSPRYSGCSPMYSATKEHCATTFNSRSRASSSP